ncbi:hypothetical protein J7443_09625 [Tropicibacter sp. R15_0]|uniref:hypothetical protein n=1 Tax=Tropicibacter sp. R15_0 TaxID=2821101 RepID=UPI001AD998FC|nr:hypothetical protein [Tropicibacter sp. R15_0]MBO9465485.1 hypothetical protein [Tropicibacter sp. R15_0]
MSKENTEMLAALGALHDDIASKIPQIDARLQAILPSLSGAMGRKVFVDAATGDDVDGLGTEESPVRSLDGAAKFMIPGGDYYVSLKTDLVVDSYVAVPAASLTLASSEIGVKRRLSWAPEIDAIDTRAPAITSTGRNCTILCRDLRLATTQVSAHVTPRGMFYGRTNLFVDLFNCEMEVPAGANHAFLSGNALYAFWLNAVTVPAEMAGLWVDGYAAGTDPATVGRLLAANTTL